VIRLLQAPPLAGGDYFLATKPVNLIDPRWLRAQARPTVIGDQNVAVRWQDHATDPESCVQHEIAAAD
jgi:hypothetical protein